MGSVCWPHDSESGPLFSYLGQGAGAGLQILRKPYGTSRLEGACERILAYSSTPSVRNIASMLKNGQDKAAAKKEEPAASNSYTICNPDRLLYAT